MSGPIRVCRPDELPALIDGALAEEYWLAPLEADADPTWLAPDHAESAGGVIVTTSGSTGTPKGVCLSGAALVAGARATQRVIGAHDWLGTLPLHYVAGLMTLVRARVAGTQFVPAQFVPADPASANGGLRRRGANAGPAALSIVATQLHRALAAADSGHPDLVADMAECPVVLVGGSAVDPGLIGRARAAGVNAVTTYGMSETAGGCVYDGVPLPGVDIVLDNGDEGRISIGGPMIFSGYRGRPDLTAETLVDSRVLTRDRGRWHCLANQGRRLEVLGRIDDVVISGGVNVDLAAVQSVVEALTPGRAAVTAVPDAEWGAMICLAVVGEGPSLAQWRERLRTNGLAPAALPKRLERVDELPLTVSGKIDRQRLRLFFS